MAELCLQRGAAFLLVCGGEPERDLLGAQLGAQLSRMEGRVAFFSSGHFKLRADFERMDGWDLLQKVMVLDREALDTLSNFTTFLRYLTEKGWLKRSGDPPPVDVVVVTSSYHARRVRAVAWVLLGSYGLSFHLAEASPSVEAAACSLWRCMRDVLRAALWLLTGFEGDILAAWMHRDRDAFRRWYREKNS